MTEPQVCPICKNPRRSSSYGSLTQWIVACNCDMREIETTEEDVPQETISMCRTCGKRIGEGRAGSFTQFIFRSDVCRCQIPAPLKEAIESAKPQPVEIVVEEVEETALEFGSTAFPTERYKALAQLGSGSGGAVYLARDLILNKRVAVKMLHMLEPRQLVAFQEEARATSRLKHPSIVSLIDFGLTGDGVPYMVLDYFQGISLDKVLDKQKTLDWTTAQPIFAKTCEALAYAHGNGIYHRDIKPSNILLARHPDGGVDVQIIDFGIAKVSKPDQSATDEQAGALVGAPIYMSPDQGLGLPYDGRSEIYSLGCVMFECLTGRPPFIGETAFQTLNMHAQMMPPSLVTANPEGQFSKGLENLVAKALAKKPTDRFQTMQEFRQAILDVDPLPDNAIGEFAPTKAPLIPLKLAVIVASSAVLLLAGAFAVLSYFKPHEPSRKEIAAAEQKQRNTETAKIERKEIEELRTGEILNELNLTGGKWNREEHNLLEGHEVTDDDFKEIVGCTERSFKVTVESQVTGEGFKYIPNAPFTSILIMSSAFNDEGARYLSKLKHIKRLCFHYDSKLTAKGLRLLAESLPDVSTVQLRFMTLPEGAVAALKPAKKLEKLDLGHSDTLTPSVCRQIAALKTIKILTITNTGITDEGLEILSKMPKLEQLDINENEISDKGLIRLATTMPQLRGIELTISGGLTSLGVKRFEKARPDCQVVIGGDSTRKFLDLVR